MRPCGTLHSCANCTFRSIDRPLHTAICRLPYTRRPFHTSRVRLATLTTHYETLNLPLDASAAQIKKQFITLSKLHHPDHNPSDPSSSTRFVAISEAYATLGSPEKRARYDRDLARSQLRRSPSPTGSYSSSAGPAGGRPASGLSKRRTRFQGPPPSFYRSGGWGDFSSKRGEYASAATGRGTFGSGTSAGAAASDHRAGAGGPGKAPGTGPGGFTGAAGDYDVPHFDRDGHFRTQETILNARQRARVDATSPEVESSGSGGGLLINFLLVSGALGTIYWFTGLFGLVGSRIESKRREG